MLLTAKARHSAGHFFTSGTRHHLLIVAALAAVMSIAFGAYAPGLSGNFLFDDYANLPTLGDYGTVNSFEHLISFLTSGIAGPTGRPVALLSFLIDDNAWPSNAEPFKYTSSLIHVLNGALLIWLSIRIARALGHPRQHAGWIGLIAGAMWLLHPFWVSTTLYVVQRMTLLSATFVLAGLLAYIHGREKLMEGAPRRGYAWMSCGIALGTLLAVLSKENGALLPTLALVIEWLVFWRAPAGRARGGTSNGFRAWRILFLVVPTMLILGYLAVKVPDAIERAAQVRDFSLAERLLTQPRILLDYIGHLLLPEPYTAGLFQDDINVSTGLLQPWTTLPALLVLLGLIGLSCWARENYPSLALAILFFFAGHLIESTVIPLELYFEHRSYLPAAFVFFPLAVLLVTASRPGRALRGTLVCIVMVAFSGLTWLRADLWGNPAQQGIVWAKENPESARAQTYAALIWKQRGGYAQARKLLETASADTPGSVMIELNRLSLACDTNRVTSEELDRAAAALRTDKRTERLAYNIIGKFITASSTGRCNGIGPTRIEGLIQATLANPAVANSKGTHQSILNLYGRLELARARPNEASAHFQEALRVKPTADAALTQAAQLGSAGYPCRGLQLLADFDELAKGTESKPSYSIEALHRWWLNEADYYASELERMSRKLKEDAIEAGQSCNLVGS